MGDRVRLKVGGNANRGGCLGKASEGRVGEVIEVNTNYQTFRVECDGRTDWYSEADVERVEVSALAKAAVGAKLAPVRATAVRARSPPTDGAAAERVGGALAS